MIKLIVRPALQITLSVLLAFIAFHPASAETMSSVDIPMPVEFVPEKGTDGRPLYLSAKQIENEIRSHSKELTGFYHNKSIEKFIVPNGQWLKQMLDAYRQLLVLSNVSPKAETWDCENYSGLLNTIATVRIWRAGFHDTRAAMGWLRADAKHSWAGIPNGVIHAIIFTATSKGIYIVEPQNGEYTPLADYPNAKYIQEVFLF